MLEQEPPTAHGQFDASMSHLCTRTTHWPQRCPCPQQHVCTETTRTDAVPAAAASLSKALEGDGVDQATNEHSLKGAQLGYYCHVCAHNTWMLLVRCLQRLTSLCSYLDLEFQFLLDADHLLCSAHLPDTFITCFHHLGKRK